MGSLENSLRLGELDVGERTRNIIQKQKSDVLQ